MLVRLPMFRDGIIWSFFRTSGRNKFKVVCHRRVVDEDVRDHVEQCVVHCGNFGITFAAAAAPAFRPIARAEVQNGEVQCRRLGCPSVIRVICI